MPIHQNMIAQRTEGKSVMAALGAAPRGKQKTEREERTQKPEYNPTSYGKNAGETRI